MIYNINIQITYYLYSIVNITKNKTCYCNLTT